MVWSENTEVRDGVRLAIGMRGQGSSERRPGDVSREVAAAFFGGGPVGAAWAAGLEERPDGWRPRFDREVMVRSLADVARRSFWGEWERVECPTLLVLGQSGIIPAPEAGEMLLRRPATAAVSVPGAGHDLHLERPEALYDVVSDFLEGLSSSAGN